MKAARIHGPGDVRVDDLVDPIPGRGDVVVEVRACGVCPSDIRSFYGATSRAPWTPGHEVAGVVVRLGEEVPSGIDVGDRVVADWRRVCGQCFYCLSGSANFCERRTEFPIAGFAEYIVVPHDVLHRLPASVTFEEATFIEPLACILNAHRAMPVEPAQDVVVLGAGPIGLMHVQVAARRGARVIAVDLLEQRLTKAEQLGAHETVDASKGDPVAAVRELTGGYGASAVIVAIGSVEAAKQAFAMSRRGGVVSLFAGFYPSSKLQLDLNVIHYDEITLTGSHDYRPTEFVESLRLVAHGIISVAPLVTHRYPLAEIAQAFATTRARNGLKSLILNEAKETPSR